MIEIPVIPGYKSFSVCRDKEARGGIICYAKKQISHTVTQIKSTCNDFHWLKLDKKHFGLDKHLYIGTIYIPPEHSSINAKRSFDIWNILEEDISKFSRDGYIYLQGDFNSRTSNARDFIPNDSLNYIPLPKTYQCDSDVRKRNSLDKIINSYGCMLNSMCTALGLRILNGRFLGDSQGNFTSFQYNGCSVIDYGVISYSLLSKVNYFKVHSLTTLSDHCMISASINLKQMSTSAQMTTKLHNFPVKYVWSSDSKEKFIIALQNTLSKNKVSIDLTNNDSIDSFSNNFTQLLINAANESLLCIRRKKNSKRKVRKPWFNNDYDKLKKDLNDVNKLFHRYPTDPFIRGKYFSLKKKLKHLSKNLKYKF